MSIAGSDLSYNHTPSHHTHMVPTYRRFPTPPPSVPLPSTHYSPLPPVANPTANLTTSSSVSFVQKTPSSRVTDGLAKAYDECKNTVSLIASQCKAKNRKFRDIHFDIENDPNQCLHTLVDSNIFGTALEARRVTEIFEKPVFYSGTKDSAQGVQGSVENCFLVSALSALTSMDPLVRNFCVARDEEVGVYGFIFYRDSYWVPVVIDDLLFTRVPKYEQLSKTEKELYHFEKAKYDVTARKGAETLYFSRPMNGSQETWIPLVEKAYAKLHGDYASLMYGRTSDAIEDLTGGVSSLILSCDMLDKDQFWTDELVNANKDRLFGCWFKSSPGMRSGIRNAMVNGLAGNLSYSVVRAVEIRDKRFVVLRDPWGDAGWDGPWSDGSKEWTKAWLQILPQLGYAFGDRGQFVMEYKDFLDIWEEIQRTLIFDDQWIVSSQWLHVDRPFPCMDASSYDDVVFKFSLPSASPTVLSFSKYNTRYFRDIQGPSMWNLSFILARDGGSEPLAESSYSFFYTRSVHVEMNLQAGNYIVLGRLNPVPYRGSDYFAKGLDSGWDRRKLARVLAERAKGQSIAENYTPNPQFIPVSLSTTLANESTTQIPSVESMKAYGIDSGDGVTVTTTTTTVIQNKNGGNPVVQPIQPLRNKIRISTFGADMAQRAYIPTNDGFGPGSLPPAPLPQPVKIVAPKYIVPAPTLPMPPMPPSPIPLPPPPLPFSPVLMPRRYSPLQVLPLAPTLMVDTLEDDHSVVVGLKVYTLKHAPTTIVGKVKNPDQAKDSNHVRY